VTSVETKSKKQCRQTRRGNRWKDAMYGEETWHGDETRFLETPIAPSSLRPWPGGILSGGILPGSSQGSPSAVGIAKGTMVAAGRPRPKIPESRQLRYCNGGRRGAATRGPFRPPLEITRGSPY
jgi:hypothetical protein